VFLELERLLGWSVCWFVGTLEDDEAIWTGDGAVLCSTLVSALVLGGHCDVEVGSLEDCSAIVVGCRCVGISDDSTGCRRPHVDTPEVVALD
jgi:hypothetical protein